MNKANINLSFTRDELEHLILMQCSSFLETFPERFEFIYETLDSVPDIGYLDKGATLAFVNDYLSAKVIHTLYLNLGFQTMIVYDNASDQYCVYKREVIDET